MIRWSDDSDLMLLTPEELTNLPAGTEITSISGEKMTIFGPGTVPDLDTRYGVTAWGLMNGRAEFVVE